MSYSDYGGFCWKKEGGVWVRWEAGEDACLIGTRAPTDRPLEAATGLKLDVLMNAQQAAGADSEWSDRDQYMVAHPHHAVLGGMKGIGLVNYKGTVTVMLDGRKALEPFSPDEEDASKDPFRGTADGYTWVVQSVSYPHSVGSMMYLRTPESAEYCAVAGYGIGKHWWKNDEGYHYLYPGDRYEMFDGSMCWVKNSEIEEEDMKKHNVDGPYVPIGVRPEEPWLTYKEWAARVTTWADSIRVVDAEGAEGCLSSA